MYNIKIFGHDLYELIKKDNAYKLKFIKYLVAQLFLYDKRAKIINFSDDDFILVLTHKNGLTKSDNNYFFNGLAFKSCIYVELKLGTQSCTAELEDAFTSTLLNASNNRKIIEDKLNLKFNNNTADSDYNETISSIFNFFINVIDYEENRKMLSQLININRIISNY